MFSSLSLLKERKTGVKILHLLLEKISNSNSGITLNRPELLWVVDIIYLLIEYKMYYLHFVTYAYTRKIVG